MTHLTYAEAMLVGLVQGVTELFPVSSLGHNVLIPALIGGSWAQDLNVSRPESPYLAFIVGLHVATAIAMIIYFRRDWIRIVGGFLSSVRDRRIATADQRLAWMIVLATIPVGIAALRSSTCSGWCSASRSRLRCSLPPTASSCSPASGNAAVPRWTLRLQRHPP